MLNNELKASLYEVEACVIGNLLYTDLIDKIDGKSHNLKNVADVT